ncbi:hypothetical protein ABT925_000222 [Salmonella enterica subsp. enterica serovar Give]
MKKYAEIVRILANSDDLMVKSFYEFVDVLESELQQTRQEESGRETACRLTLALMWLMGGRSFYLPKASDASQMLLRLNLLSDWKNGVCVPELVKKYKISEARTYSIIRKHMADLRK